MGGTGGPAASGPQERTAREMVQSTRRSDQSGSSAHPYEGEGLNLILDSPPARVPFNLDAAQLRKGDILSFVYDQGTRKGLRREVTFHQILFRKSPRGGDASLVLQCYEKLGGQLNAVRDYNPALMFDCLFKGNIRQSQESSDNAPGYPPAPSPAYSTLRSAFQTVIGKGLSLIHI